VIAPGVGGGCTDDSLALATWDIEVEDRVMVIYECFCGRGSGRGS